MLESTATKIDREVDLAAQGFDGMWDAIDEGFTKQRAQTLIEAGTGAAMGAGFAFVKRLPGVAVPLSLAMTAGVLAAGAKNLLENGSPTFDAFKDNWQSADHWQKNRSVVRHNVGQYLFDSVVMSVAGGLTTAMIRGFVGGRLVASRSLVGSAETAESAPAIDDIARVGRGLSGFDATSNAIDGPVFVHSKVDISPALPNAEVQKALHYQRDTSENSAWLRTVDGYIPLPSLQGRVDADVAVVGSGVLGQQIAYRLAELGKKVVVLEANEVGSGTSSMMGAMNTVVPDTGFGPMLERLGPDKFSVMMRRILAGRQRVELLGRKYGDFRPVNSYNVAYTEHNADVFLEAQLLRQFDPGVRLVNGDEAQSIFPLAKSVAILPREGNVNPMKMLNGMARSGLYRVFVHSPVEAIAQTTDGALVFTPKGTVQAGKVILATNHPVAPFADANEHLTPVQTFSNIVEIGRSMPGNYFDSPDQSGGKVAFSYWRQFGLTQFRPDETLVGGAAHFLDRERAMPFEPQLPEVTARLFNGAQGRNQSTALIWTDYKWGLPLYYNHPKFKAIWTALGGGGNGLNSGSLLAQAAEMQESGQQDGLLLPTRGLANQ